MYDNYYDTEKILLGGGMSEFIAALKSKGSNKVYYYHQLSYRVKINPKDSGKTRGTGPSKVITEKTYLGTAKDVLNKFKDPASRNYENEIKSFGLETALYNIACEIELPKVLRESFPGEVSSTSVADFLLVSAISRVCEPIPKTQIPKFLKKSSLPEIMGLDPKVFTSQNFWLAYERVISESDVAHRREEIKKLRSKKKREKAELGFLCEEKINKFQVLLFEALKKNEGIDADEVYYDTTNFYTYLQNNNGKALLAARGKNKDGKHHLNQITLAMAITKQYGLPILHLLFKGNYNDKTLFPDFMGKLINHYHNASCKVEDLLLIYDKGNNSKDNYENLKEKAKGKIKVDVVGSLQLSHYEDLLRKRIENYPYEHNERKYYSTEKYIFGGTKKVVVVYHPETKAKQEHSLEKNIKKYRHKMREYFNGLSEKTRAKREKEKMEQDVLNQVPYPEYRVLFKVEVTQEKQLKIKLNLKALAKKRKHLGKTILFTDKMGLSPNTIIDLYFGSSIINEDHKILKMPKGVLFRPFWHWTDSKIRVQGMVNIIALMLYRLLEKRLNERQEMIKMNSLAIKSELVEIKKVLKMDKNRIVEVTLNRLTENQKVLFKVYRLDKYVTSRRINVIQKE